MMAIRSKRLRFRRAGSERGSAVVETAVTTIILLTVVFGIMDLSLAVYSFFFVPMPHGRQPATRSFAVRL